MNYFLNKGGYRTYILKKFRHESKEKIIKIATFVFPTYKMARFLKDQNFDIMKQNEFLMDEIIALRKEVERRKK